MQYDYFKSDTESLLANENYNNNINRKIEVLGFFKTKKTTSANKYRLKNYIVRSNSAFS